MSAARVFLARLAGLLRGDRHDREMVEEFASHLAMEVEANLRSGMTPEQARRAALVKSGGLAPAAEAYRDRRGLPAVEHVIRDIHYALRLFVRTPEFSLIAVLSLALGIGANTAIFTLLDQLMLRRLPVRDPGQLQMIWTTGPHLGSNQGSRASSYPMYQDFERRAEAFTYVFCRYYTPLSITIANESERIIGELVSGNYFQALGVRPALGRVFSPEEDDRAYKGHPVLVLSHQYWLARFGGDPGVIGTTILVNNYPMVIVGVSAEGFTGIDPARSPQVRVPIQMKPLMTPASDNLGDRRRQWVQVFARRKPAYTLETARASLQPLLAGILREEADSPALRGIPRPVLDQFLARRVMTESAATGYSELRRSYSTGLVALMGMVGLVLLIACFNVAGLLIARAEARRKELGMRIALGASRARLLRQLLIESAMLSAAGAGLGLLVSGATVRGMLRFLPAGGMLATLSSAPDERVLAFNAAAALLTVLLFGLAPARQAVAVDLWNTLREGAGSVGGGRSSTRLRKGLVIAQVALSFLLVAGSLLFVRTLLNLRETPSGFGEIDNLVTFQIDPARSGYSLPRLKAFYARLLDDVRALPAVESAAYAWVQVLSGREADWDVRVEGHPAGEEDMQAFVNGLSPGYWRTLGVPLIEGRDFEDRDVDGRARVAIVNRAFARRFFPGSSPVGRYISVNTDPEQPLDIEIVGLVEDSLYDGPRQGVRRQVFFPFSQMNQSVGTAFYVRGTADSTRLLAILARTVRELDARVPVFELKTLHDQLDETLGTERLSAMLSVAFGALATLLAAVGLYGVVSLTVARRTREIGLRKALGAAQASVLWMVMKEALGVAAVGIGLGIPVAYVLARSVSSQLFGVAVADARMTAAAAGILVVVVVGAALAPARRAASIDPIRALHHE